MGEFVGISPIYVILAAVLILLLIAFLWPKKKEKKERTAYERSIMLESKLYQSLEDLVLKKTQHLYTGSRLVAKTKILVEIVALLKSRFTTVEQVQQLLQFNNLNSADLEVKFEAIMYAIGVYLNKVRKVTTVDNSIMEDSPFSYWVRTKLELSRHNDVGSEISEEAFIHAWKTSGFSFSYADSLNILALCLFGTVYGCGPIECLIDQPGIAIHLSIGGQGQFLRRDIHEEVPLDAPVWVLSKGKYYHLEFIKFVSSKELGEVVKRLRETGKSDHEFSDWLSSAKMSSVSDNENTAEVFSDLLKVNKEDVEQFVGGEESTPINLNEAVAGLTSAERKQVVKEKHKARHAKDTNLATSNPVGSTEFNKPTNVGAIDELSAFASVLNSQTSVTAGQATTPEAVVVTASDLDLNSLTMFGIVGNSAGVDTVNMVTSIVDASEKRSTRRTRRRIDLGED